MYQESLLNCLHKAFQVAGSQKVLDGEGDVRLYSYDKTWTSKAEKLCCYSNIKNYSKTKGSEVCK